MLLNNRKHRINIAFGLRKASGKCCQMEKEGMISSYIVIRESFMEEVAFEVDRA